jgi:hypothetical protein
MCNLSGFKKRPGEEKERKKSFLLFLKGRKLNTLKMIY